MKNFSDETKKLRRNAVLKVIAKRYSFIIWLPLLICITYYIGRIVILIDGGSINDSCGTIGKIIITILLGLLGLLILCLLLMLGIILINTINNDIIIPIKEKTFFKGLKDFFKLLGGILLEIIKVIPKVLLFVLKIPVYLFRRIKDEKRRFENAVEKQIIKDSKKKVSKDIEN